MQGGSGGGGGGGGRQRRRQHLRKRKKDSDDEGDAPQGQGHGGEAAALAEKRGGKKAGLSFGTAEAKSAAAAAALGPLTYEGSGTKQAKSDMGATRERLTETEIDKDGRAIREKRIKTSGDAAAGEEANAAGANPGATTSYKGMLSYTDYRSGFRREQNASNMKATGAFGPLRASSAIRSTFRMDYQPDVCKDWKETGYCGYGDSCKFLHDRSDYKSGWQLDREWEAKEKLRREQQAVKAFLGEGDGEEAGAAGADGAGEKKKEDDGLPFACHICRLPFENPVVTKCKHYFCEHCALKENAKTGKCAICKKDTNGTFNVAVALAKKMREQKAAGA